MPEESNDSPIDRLELEYRGLAPLAETFCSEVSRQLNQMLSDAGIPLGFPIEFRVKTWASLTEKLDRKSFQLSTITDLSDLIGLRIILLFRRDVEATCAAIEQHFEVLESYDTQERLREDQFGYSSKHFIIRLPEHWLALPTFSQLGSFKAEIQVRTIAQHIWAAASHNLQYKQEENVPIPVRRSISRVSALLETVDLELERVLDERQEYRATLAATSMEEIVEDEVRILDVDLLQRLLSEGFPAENKAETEDYGELLRALSQRGIVTSKQLQDVISANIGEVLAEEKKYVNTNQELMKKGARVHGTDEDRAERGVYFTHAGLLRRILWFEAEKSGEDTAPKPVRRTKKK
jgi:putative GTP pyrophosphokinase